MGATVGALVIVTDLDFLLVFKLLNLIDSFYGGIIGLNKWFLASCLVALFPIIGLAYLAAVVSLLAAGAGEEGDVGDTAVGTARGHGGHAEVDPKQIVVFLALPSVRLRHEKVLLFI